MTEKKVWPYITEKWTAEREEQALADMLADKFMETKPGQWYVVVFPTVHRGKVMADLIADRLGQRDIGWSTTYSSFIHLQREPMPGDPYDDAFQSPGGLIFATFEQQDQGLLRGLYMTGLLEVLS